MFSLRRNLLAILLQLIAALSGAESGLRAEDKASAEAVSQTVALEDVACPFELTDAEQEQADQILEKWETRSRSIRSYRCEFTRREYHAALYNDPRVTQGEILYKWPNRTTYRVFGSAHERWERDEKAIRGFDYSRKVMSEHRLTEKEKNADSWPVPLLYQVHAADLKRDYWIRSRSDYRREGEILLELHPRQRPVQQLDNIIQWWNEAMSKGYFYRYQAVHVLLREADFEPFALCFPLPNGDRTTFVFGDVEAGTENLGRTVSEIICDFARPVPTGWTKLER